MEIKLLVLRIVGYMLWFNFILGSNFIFLCFKLIITHYNTQKQKKINLNQGKIEPQHIHKLNLQNKKITK